VAARELDEGDVLVLDGSLQTAFTNESKYSSILYDIAKKRGVIVSGLSKTSSLFTTTGLSLIGAMNKLAEDSALPHALWYFLVAEALSMDHNAAIFVVKLSPKAERIFRYEIYREQFSRLDKDELNSIIDLLTKNSQDISFPGYPYGLIDADKYARVSNDEVECYQALLLSEISKQGKWPKFSRHIHAMDAHSILNMIMG
jgi:hypothetical protein